MYSPTRTENWLLCPMRRHLEKRWRPRNYKADELEITLLIGRAIHAGAAAYFEGVKAGTDADPLAIAASVVETEFVDDGTHTLLGVQTLVKKGVMALLEAVTLEPDEKVVGTELTVGECRIDLVTRTPKGLRVWDLKSKRHLKSDWLAKELKRYEASWQLRHEAWAAAEMFGEPVFEARVILVVLSPKVKAHVWPVEMDAAKVARWLVGAERVWRLMGIEDVGIAPPFMNTSSCDKFGGCPFLNFCHTVGGDEKRAETLYERIG